LRLGKFSAVMLLNKLPMPLVCTSSSIPMIHSFGLLTVSQKFFMFRSYFLSILKLIVLNCEWMVCEWVAWLACVSSCNLWLHSWAPLRSTGSYGVQVGSICDFMVISIQPMVGSD
jgi:hypothetical protein